ncbi:MAG: metal-dependent hydrolase [Planctomycetota bacterium]
MTSSITYLGHSACLIESGSHSIAIDPFLTGNPRASCKADDLNPTHVALTHGHDDHVGDTVSIAKRTGATVFAAFELCGYLGEQGLEKLEPGHIGGQVATDFGFLALTIAFHGSSNGDGRYLGMPAGVVVRVGDVTIYHAGDTALFSDMKLIRELYAPDVAILPVGDRFTMGPEHAKIAAEWIKPKITIPVHYATWPLLASDISAFAPEGVEVKALEPGQSVEL